jgi:hypothetical protein
MYKNLVLLFLIAAPISASQVTDTIASQSTLVEAITWLENETHRLIRASRRTIRNDIASFPPQVGIGYEAFWLKDYVYTLEGSVDSYS